MKVLLKTLLLVYLVLTCTTHVRAQTDPSAFADNISSGTSKTATAAPTADPTATTTTAAPTADPTATTKTAPTADGSETATESATAPTGDIPETTAPTVDPTATTTGIETVPDTPTNPNEHPSVDGSPDNADPSTIEAVSSRERNEVVQVTYKKFHSENIGKHLREMVQILNMDSRELWRLHFRMELNHDGTEMVVDEITTGLSNGEVMTDLIILGRDFSSDASIRSLSAKDLAVQFSRIDSTSLASIDILSTRYVAPDHFNELHAAIEGASLSSAHRNHPVAVILFFVGVVLGAGITLALAFLYRQRWLSQTRGSSLFGGGAPQGKCYVLTPSNSDTLMHDQSNLFKTQTTSHLSDNVSTPLLVDGDEDELVSTVRDYRFRTGSGNAHSHFTGPGKLDLRLISGEASSSPIYTGSELSFDTRDLVDKVGGESTQTNSYDDRELREVIVSPHRFPTISSTLIHQASKSSSSAAHVDPQDDFIDDSPRHFKNHTAFTSLQHTGRSERQLHSKHTNQTKMHKDEYLKARNQKSPNLQARLQPENSDLGLF